MDCIMAYVAVKHVSVHFIPVADDVTCGGCYTQCTIWGGRRGKEKKTIMLTVYISVCVQKKLESITVDICPQWPVMTV